jgi:hypothetical protein
MFPVFDPLIELLYFLFFFFNLFAELFRFPCSLSRSASRCFCSSSCRRTATAVRINPATKSPMRFRDAALCRHSTAFVARTFPTELLGLPKPVFLQVRVLQPRRNPSDPSGWAHEPSG